ncbi:glutamate--tRNA ligase [Candidatus Heimdallarchaeota archaeon]|nr:MAG: glutamate--tRNA ligase [Candidatus Heimdallarchaeota archaeon]
MVDVVEIDEIREIVRKYTLDNAVKYDGKAQVKSVMQKIMGTHKELRSRAKVILKEVEQTIPKINSLSPAEQLKELKKIAPELLEQEDSDKRPTELPPLENALEGKVKTRYAPEPNGDMHIGHAFTAFFAHYYAQRYEGTFLLRFEDTNPAQERTEFMDAHRESLAWLGLEPDEEVIVSYDLPFLYEKAEKLIEKDLAYTCSCTSDTMHTYRNEEKLCKHASATPEETLQTWEKMLAGKFDEGDMVLRLRGDIHHKNAVMREPVIFTIRKDSHCLQGEKYNLWPLYDFAAAIEDYKCGITHIGRSSEFDTRIELQNYIREVLGMLPQPEIFHFARFNVIGSPASKRKIKPLISEGKVEGWDDIRLVTIKGLRKRGITPAAIKAVAKEIGMTTQPTNIDWSLIEAKNRQIIDSQANRYFFVPNPVLVYVKNAPEGLISEIPLHPDFPDRGIKKQPTGLFFLIPNKDYLELAIEKEFRLKDLYNIILTDKEVNLFGKNEPEVISSFDKEQQAFLKQFKHQAIAKYTDEELKPGPKIQWTAADPRETIPVEVKIPEVLFIDGKYNKNSLHVTTGFAEKAATNLQVGDIVQFERFGFIRVDQKKDNKLLVNRAHK